LTEIKRRAAAADTLPIMKTDRGSFRMIKREQLMPELVHDTYRTKGKRSGPAVCSGCSAVYRRGRWRWESPPPGVLRTRCPACLRIRQRLPGASVTLRGRFFSAHRDEILALVRNCERAEKETHPMQRIMSITEGVVTTTDAHLARRIGDALRRAYKGELDYRYSKADNLLRVSWWR
jgi:hypothetical protein